MDKPKDIWDPSQPRQTFTDWPHAVVRSTIDLRFTTDTISQINVALMESFGTVNDLGKIKIHGYLPASCPECGCRMRLHTMTNKHGSTVHWPQCATHPANRDHGFGSFSRHGKIGTPGRNPGGNYRPRAPRPAPVSVDPPAPSLPVIPDTSAVEVYHERLPDLLALYRAGMRAFLLEGPAGSGKTSLGESLAKVLGHKVVTVSGCRETEKGELTKRAHPVSGVERLSPLMDALCDPAIPAVGTVDEADGIPPDVMLALNQPSANRCLFVNGERHELHPDSVIILTANATNGTSRVYTGRFPMDGATKSRFFPIFCDYSPNIERSVCKDHDLMVAVSDLRKRVNNDPQLAKSFAAVVGTRLILQAGITGRAYNLTGRAALAKVFELGYPAEVARQLLG